MFGYHIAMMLATSKSETKKYERSSYCTLAGTKSTNYI